MARAQVDLRFQFDGLPGHKLQVEASREGRDVGVHFDQSKMFADARARAKAEGKIGKAVPAGDVGREKAVGIEPVRIGPVRRVPLHG